MRARSLLVALLSSVASCQFPNYAVVADGCLDPLCNNGGESASPSSGSGGSGAGPNVAGAGAAANSGAPAIGGSVGGGQGGDGTPGSSGAGGEPAEPDDCPDDPAKVSPGECGCGVPDLATADLADCQGIKAALIHHYDFEGSGTQVTDQVGSAHGMIARNATLSKLNGRGVLLLGGGETGAYVDLPNGLVSKLSNVTIEAWVTWGGGPANQRIFDFGNADAPEGQQGSGQTYLFVTPTSNAGKVEAIFSSTGTDGSDRTVVTGGSGLSQNLSQIVVVANSDSNELSLFVDGIRLSKQSWTAELSALQDSNVWLGRSQWAVDPELNAIFHDFRIYDQALTSAQVASTFVAGTDPVFLAK